MSILIKDVWFKGEKTSIFIESQFIKKIDKHISQTADMVIDGSNKAAIPGFINGHSHAAMTLFRGYGDDMPLDIWLNTKIWPVEAKMTEEDVYVGAKLACLEMIKNGITSFMDMYWHINGTARAVEEMGLRAMLSHVVFDNFDEKTKQKTIADIEIGHQQLQQYSDRIQESIGPHAPYTVSSEFLRWTIEKSQKYQLPIHIHGSETESEYHFTLDRFGLTPIRYLDSLGLLSPDLSIAHCVYVDDEEIELLAKHQVKVVYNVNSNLKLASGIFFKYQKMKEAGIVICMGTDGCSSSNNLDLIEAVKHASLVQKGITRNPELLSSEEAFDMITQNGGLLLNQKIGLIKENYLADICLVDLKQPAFVPDLKYNFVSNLIYAANGSCIDTVICNGQILMQNRVVANEEAIMEEAQETAEKLFRL